MRHTVFAIAVLAMILGMAIGLAREVKPGSAVKPGDALVVRVSILPRSGVGKVSAIRIADPAKLAALEKFFPHYRDRPASEWAGAWEAGYHIYFDFPGGETIRVTVSDGDGRSWSTGHGDFATKDCHAGFTLRSSARTSAQLALRRVCGIPLTS